MHGTIIYIHGAIPLAFLLPFANSPLSPLCISFYLLGTLLAVTGIVHLGLRLLVNCPHLPHPSPSPPLPSKFPEPQLPSASLRRPREYSGSCYPEQGISQGSFFRTGNSSQVHIILRVQLSQTMVLRIAAKKCGFAQWEIPQSYLLQTWTRSQVPFFSLFC